MPSLEELIADLEAEHRDLDRVVRDLEPSEWDIETPAEPWTVRDQISHLTFFDDAATLAARDPEVFSKNLAEAGADVEGYMAAPLEKGRAMEPRDVLSWWRAARDRMLETFRGLDPAARVPWFGPPMSSASFITARLMETWAHGQDVVDALGIARQPTDRLRHICFLGYRARRFSYVANGKPEPQDDVRVELSAPDGSLWTFGESDTNVVRGPALDFCLAVTQRRHLDDTALEIEGPAARGWMEIAQAFAGPPGPGRKPGQFASPA